VTCYLFTNISLGNTLSRSHTRQNNNIVVIRRWESRRSPKAICIRKTKKYGEERFAIWRLEFFPLRFWPDRSNLRAILNQVPSKSDSRGGKMTSYTISRLRLHTTSGFVFNVVALYRSEVQNLPIPYFIDNTSIYCWDITTSGLEKQTSAILEFCFRLLLRPYHNNWPAIPHQATKFRQNRVTRGAVMTSYTFSRWRQRWLNITSGFVCNDVTFIGKSKSIRKLYLVQVS